MLSLPLRCSRLLVGLVLTATVAPAVSAREPTLRETLQAVTESMTEMSDASVRVARAKAEYEAQLELVREAARGLADVFATAPVETPKPSTAIIDALLDFSGPSRLEQLRPKPALRPLTRLEALLMPSKITPALDPNGTSIYDSLSFGP